MSGITIGHIIQLILVCFGLGKIFQIFPQIQNILKILCAIYLLYLGYKIIGSFNKIKEDGSKPLKFYEAALFQIVNPKAWTISTMAASGFLPKEGNLIISIFFIAIVAIKNIEIIKLPSFGKKPEAAIVEIVHALGFTI